jgi:NhaA family Na+:H+ antiporter
MNTSKPENAAPAIGLETLGRRLAADHEWLAYPAKPWAEPPAGVLNCAVIGGGQFGLTIAHGLKRECVEGELSRVSLAVLPVGAAIGGVALPAAIYAALNWGTPALQGWAIPSATDIAFSLGVLSLFGSRVPASLKVFLMALAVIDDLVAVLIIALFYTHDLNLLALALSGGVVLLLALLNRAGITRASPYLLLGALLWLAVMESGVHATVAGVMIGGLMPVNTGKRVSDRLHTWVAFGILPLFAFANAGISLTTVSIADMQHPITMGVVLGLFMGKQLGIIAASWLLVKSGCARLPEGMNWKLLYAVSAIAGIGFTMSLFIGNLAFANPDYLTYIKLGVMLGSLVSALFGAFLLHCALKGPAR